MSEWQRTLIQQAFGRIESLEKALSHTPDPSDVPSGAQAQGGVALGLEDLPIEALKGAVLLDEPKDPVEFLLKESVTPALIADGVPASKLKGLDATVTALPTNPSNGDFCVFAASSTVHWLLRYSIVSAKWHYLGGPPLADDKSTAFEGEPSGAWADIGTVGPSLTTPAVAGTYDTTIGAVAGNNGAGTAAMSFSLNGATPVDNDIQYCEHHFTGAQNARSTITSISRMAMPASSTVVMKYKSVTIQSFYMLRWLRMIPVTLG